MTEKQLFWEHLANSSLIVNEWPEWKKAGMSWTTSPAINSGDVGDNRSAIESASESGDDECQASSVAKQLLIANL